MMVGSRVVLRNKTNIAGWLIDGMGVNALNEVLHVVGIRTTAKYYAAGGTIDDRQSRKDRQRINVTSLTERQYYSLDDGRHGFDAQTSVVFFAAHVHPRVYLNPRKHTPDI